MKMSQGRRRLGIHQKMEFF
uniref:Uncharacterized protein n=1 Tax=Rhizophora mucronata TaxID=61149 RepID=A0A2P2IVI5_RHIMU